MSLWVDKYRPTSLSKLNYHIEQAEYLKNMVQKGDFPHLLVYGPPGSGKKTRIMCTIRELFGSGVDRVRMDTMSFETPSKKKLEISTISSNFHIEVNLSDIGIYDRIVVMDLVKTTAQTHQIDPSGLREFKVIVLTNVDELTKDAQHALRRTMEKYITTCRLILCANSTSRVLPAVKSRCLGIRVAAPKLNEIQNVLQSICKKEGLLLPDEFALKVAKTSGRNLRRAILMLEACKVQQYPFTVDQEVTEPDWQLYIKNTVVLMMSEQNPKILLDIRNRLQELLWRLIPCELIFKGFLQEFMRHCDLQLKMAIVKHAAEYEHRMQHGNKPIIHLEAFIACVMSDYKDFVDSTYGDALSGDSTLVEGDI